MNAGILGFGKQAGWVNPTINDLKIMNSQILGLRVASAIFGLMAIAHVVRLLMRLEVLVAGHLMPLWPSALVFVILGGLSIWLWKLSHRQTG